MPSNIRAVRPNFAIIATFFVFVLGGCASTSPNIDDVNDPFEPTNRAIHGFNKGVDTVVLRPASSVYGAITPDPVERAIANGASNLSLPSDIINHTLQGDIGSAFKMTGRFLINSTVGLLGLFDPATELNLADDSTDFGETLHVWGVSEGPYVELPLLGPSTARDATGRIADIALNPLGYLLPSQELEYTYVVRGLDILGMRHRSKDIIDPVLYGSEDSYSAARVGYLLNRRNALQGGVINEDDLDDPFAFDQ